MISRKTDELILAIAPEEKLDDQRLGQ